jgi:hypothetical protein
VSAPRGRLERLRRFTPAEQAAATAVYERSSTSLTAALERHFAEDDLYATSVERREQYLRVRVKRQAFVGEVHVRRAPDPFGQVHNGARVFGTVVSLSAEPDRDVHRETLDNALVGLALLFIVSGFLVLGVVLSALFERLMDAAWLSMPLGFLVALSVSLALANWTYTRVTRSRRAHIAGDEITDAAEEDWQAFLDDLAAATAEDLPITNSDRQGVPT